MKRVQQTGLVAAPRRRGLVRGALVLLAALVATLVGCGTGPGESGTDTAPPSLTLSGVRDGEVRSDAELAFDVVASDPSAVAAVTWSSDHGDAGTCAPTGDDAYACGPVPLPAGTIAITVRAGDVFGNLRTLSFSVTRDATPPTLSVSGIADGTTVYTGHVEATVTSRDDVSVPGVTWSTDEGDAGTCAPTLDDAYACGPIPLVPGANAVTFTAEDAAGNRATASYVVSYAPPSGTDVTPPSLSLSGVLDGETVGDAEIAFEARASDASGIEAVGWSTEHGEEAECSPAGSDRYACGPVPLPPGATTITVEAFDPAGNRRTATVTVHRDVAPPTLSVSGLADGATVDTAQVSATVTSVDDRSFPTVTWSTDAGEEGACPWIGGDDHDCGPIPLTEGDTTIAFRSEDAVGNATTASYLVTYAPDTGVSGFTIEIVFFDEAFTSSQRAAFEAAADRWERLVVGDLQDVPLDLAAGVACGQGEPAYTGTVDDLLIFATSFTEGVGGLLGSAGPCRSRSSGPDAGTNAVGFMRFDTMDLGDLEARGDLVETIVHEMGHVLGIGTNWEWGYHDLLDYVASDGASDCRSASGFTVPPTYVGAEGIDAWHDLGGSGGVPVEDGGGLGTRCGHWDEATFDHELMTGYLDAGRTNPLSALSVRSLEDIGLTVDASAADPYSLPSGASLNAAGGFDIARAELLLPSRGTVDPLTGEIEDVPTRVR
jgi:hypothetical protein